MRYPPVDRAKNCAEFCDKRNDSWYYDLVFVAAKAVPAVVGGRPQKRHA
jgi:hypothetical protein